MQQSYPVSVNHAVLAEFREEFELIHFELENIAIDLERLPRNIQAVEKMHKLFKQLMISSVKLDFVPLTECLEDVLTSLSLLIKWRFYPVRMSEFVLLLIDRLLTLAYDVENNFFIDIRKIQSMLVALQVINLVKSPEKLESAVEQAINAIMRDVNLIADAKGNQDSVTLFDNEKDTADKPLNQLESDSGKTQVGSEQAFSGSPTEKAKSLIEKYDLDHPIMLLAKISDVAAQYSESHSRFMLEMGLAINYMAGEIINPESLAVGICLHDIGLATHTKILHKEGPLDENEVHLMRQHPIIGAKLARELDKTGMAETIVLHHHERMDGRGYPNGLVGDEICDGGKLLAIINSFHAMICKRPYKQHKKSLLRAISEINACVGSRYDHRWVVQFNLYIRNHWLPEINFENSNPQVSAQK